LRTLDPRAKIAIIVMLSIVCFLLEDAATIVAVFAIALGLWFLARLTLRDLYGYVKPMLFLFLFLILAQGFFYPGATRLPYLAFVPFTLEGARYGAMLCVRVLTLACSFPLLLATSSVEELALALTRMGLPYKTAYTAITALNQVPVLRSDIASIIAAQKLRACAAFEGRSPLKKLKAYPALVIPLVMSSMRRANLMGTAMDARAFGCSPSRTSIHRLRFRMPDAAATLAAASAMAVLVLADRFLLV
jgi:energy-coupling factor transport system permease protein